MEHSSLEVQVLSAAPFFLFPLTAMQILVFTKISRTYLNTLTFIFVKAKNFRGLLMKKYVSQGLLLKVRTNLRVTPICFLKYEQTCGLLLKVQTNLRFASWALLLIAAHSWVEDRLWDVQRLEAWH